MDSRRCVERSVTNGAINCSRSASFASQETAVVPCQTSLVVRQCLRLGGITAIGTAGRGCQGDGAPEASRGIQRIGTGLLLIELAQLFRRGRLAPIPTQEEDCAIVLKAGRFCPLLPRIRGGGAHAIGRGWSDTRCAAYGDSGGSAGGGSADGLITAFRRHHLGLRPLCWALLVPRRPCGPPKGAIA
jgi:hypothetical protein